MQPSLLEQALKETEAKLDYCGMTCEAQRVIGILSRTQASDSRFKKHRFAPLISERCYNKALQIAWVLLAHTDEQIADVGDKLIHRLLDYNLARREYAIKNGE